MSSMSRYIMRLQIAEESADLTHGGTSVANAGMRALSASPSGAAWTVLHSYSFWDWVRVRVTVHLLGDGGIHGSPAKSWVRASMAEMPFLRVVDR